MTKAVRFSVVNTVAEAVAEMLNTTEFVAPSEVELVYGDWSYDAKEDTLFDYEGYPISEGKGSRMEFLMETHNCSRLQAYELYLNEQREMELSNIAWLNDSANRDSEIYSDVFKDTYGFRPRW